MIVSCFVEDCFDSREGSDQRQHQGFIQLETCSAKVQESFFKHNVKYCPNLWVTCLCASLETTLSVLNTAAGAPFKELLCVWRWRRCSCGWKEGGYFNVLTRQNAPLSFRPTSDRVACRSQFILLLYNTMNERFLLLRTAAHWQSEEMPISQSYLKKKKTVISVPTIWEWQIRIRKPSSYCQLFFNILLSLNDLFI